VTASCLGAGELSVDAVEPEQQRRNLQEITNALETFKSEVASGAATGYVTGGLSKKDGD
jgi:hypothetical protein